MRRIPDVLDCWFESGSMPYAQIHYPFENKEWFENNFPADFISEGLDQTRGWFYTLTILAAALFDKPAFKNVIVNGLVLAEDGKKMSKSERNFSDPKDIIDSFGADALRMFLINSAVVRGEDLKYSDQGIKDVLKGFIIPFWNAYSFFITYANIDNFEPKDVSSNPDNPLDKWILSEAEYLVSEVTLHLDKYDLSKGIGSIIRFIDLLNNWYIRRSRRRFWRSENDVDKIQAYETLYSVLMSIIHVAAPFIPFITEEIYQNLRTDSMPESVHLADFPIADNNIRDHELEKKMTITRQAVSMGRSLRSIHSLKIRQPLQSIYIVTRDSKEKAVLREMEDIIIEELNVKQVIFKDNEEDLVEYQAKANFKVLGKSLGRNMKAAASRIEQLTMLEIQSLIDGSTLQVNYGDGEFTLKEDGIVIQRFEKENLKVLNEVKGLNEGSLTIGLDSEITEDLLREGTVRDIVRSIQNLRKERNLDVTDRINLKLDGTDWLKEAVNSFMDHLLSETLSDSISWERTSESSEISWNDITCFIDLEKS